MLQFDEKTTRLLDDAYAGADFSRRRRASFDALEPATGDVILDLGCGNGLLTLDLSRAVGPSGRIVALDASDDMLKSARDRCRGRDNIAFVEATAQASGLPDASVDKVVSLQVFEYFDDLDGPLAELARVMKPGGRLVIGDMLWDTFVWHSDNPDRMDQMIGAWARHVSHDAVPRVLPRHLQEAGFGKARATAVPFLDTQLKPDGLANMTMMLLEAYATHNKLVEASVVEAWREEQLALARQGRFFMHLLHVVWTAERL